jgi:hypothetical protein
VKPTDVDRITEYTTNLIKGTRNMYYVWFVGSMDVNKLLKKNLACFCCFCCFCVDYNFSTCENLPWTKNWEVEVLIPNNMGYVCNALEATFQKDEWDSYGIDGDHLVDCISLGESFDVNAEEGNEEGVDFYTKTSFIVEQPFTCPWVKHDLHMFY